MRLDHAFVLYTTDPEQGVDIVAAYLDEADALAALKAHQASGQEVAIERCPLAASTGAGIPKDRREGRQETEHALEDGLRSLTRHNVAGCTLVVNAFGGGARMHFPTWSTIQAEGDNVQARLLDGTDAPRTDASVDLLNRLAQGMVQQTQGLVRLAQDIHGRRNNGAKRLVVVPGLPQGMPRPPGMR